MNEHEVEYTDDDGEIVGELRPVPDFLPPPEELIMRTENAGEFQILLTLSGPTIDCFQRIAAERGVPWHRLIRTVVEEHAQREQEAASSADRKEPAPA